MSNSTRRESFSPVLRLSQKKLAEMFEKGEAEIVHSRLVQEETKAWEKFLGKKLETQIPEPPKELLATLGKAKETGWFQAEAHFLPKMELTKDSDIPGWIKPNKEYWRNIETGVMAEDAATLPGIWVIIDGLKKQIVRRITQQCMKTILLDQY